MLPTIRPGNPRVLYFDRRIGVLRKSCLCRIVLCLLTGATSVSTGWAQDSGRDDNRGERYFKEMDRDRDGTISEEEYNRADERIRNRLKEAGLAYRPGLTLDQFSKAGPKLDELRDKEREQDKQSRDSRGEGDRRGPDSGSSRGKPKEKVKLNVALPAAYTAIDKDHDGQIGLYEWERAKFAEFRAIDRNGDGFLSPKELVAGPKTAAVASGPTALPSGPVAPNAPNTPPPVASPGRPSAATPAAPVGSAPAVVTTAPEDDKETKQAKFYFKTVDKNSDGTITQEEWSESRGIRVKFEQANATPSLPLSEDDFVKQYRALEQKKSST